MGKAIEWAVQMAAPLRFKLEVGGASPRLDSPLPRLEQGLGARLTGAVQRQRGRGCRCVRDSQAGGCVQERAGPVIECALHQKAREEEGEKRQG